MEKHDVCPLCGNQFGIEDKKHCKACGASAERFFGIILGYIYPSEAKVVKDVLKYFVIAIVIILAVSGFLWVNIQHSINTIR